ncbi:hypothetical protein [Niabella terrae]
MKAIYLFLISLCLLGCTKQRLEKFNSRIVGNWALVEVNTFGIGNSHIIFDGGHFQFNNDNTAIYYDRTEQRYSGNWSMDAYTYYSDDDETETDFILTIDVNGPGGRKFDQLEIPRFGNANRFKAKVYNSINTVTYIFERR